MTAPLYEVIKDLPSDYKHVPEECRKKGARVFYQLLYDYGLARDDTDRTDIQHHSFTLDPQGGYPGFTMPMTHVREVKEEEADVKPLSPQDHFDIYWHLSGVCKGEDKVISDAFKRVAWNAFYAGTQVDDRNTWQPIETAPRNFVRNNADTDIDLWHKEYGRVADCCWVEAAVVGFAWFTRQGGRLLNMGTDDAFTHWKYKDRAPV